MQLSVRVFSWFNLQYPPSPLPPKKYFVMSCSYLYLKKKKLIDFIFQSSLRFIAKLNRKYSTCASAPTQAQPLSTSTSFISVVHLLHSMNQHIIIKVHSLHQGSLYSCVISKHRFLKFKRVFLILQFTLIHTTSKLMIQ